MTKTSLSTEAALNVAGLLLAMVGIVVQIIGGVHYPTVPPGLIILAVAAGLVAFAPWRWTAFVGVAVPLFLFVGGAISPVGRHDLSIPSHAGAFYGSIIQAVGVILALAAGLAVLRLQYFARRAGAPA